MHSLKDSLSLPTSPPHSTYRNAVPNSFSLPMHDTRTLHRLSHQPPPHSSSPTNIGQTRELIQSTSDLNMIPARPREMLPTFSCHLPGSTDQLSWIDNQEEQSWVYASFPSPPTYCTCLLNSCSPDVTCLFNSCSPMSRAWLRCLIRRKKIN